MDNSATPEPQPAASLSQRPRFQFGLRTLLLLFVVLGSSLGVFGAWGIIVFGLEVGLAVYMHGAKSLEPLRNCVLAMLTLSGPVWLWWTLPEVGSRAARHLNWPNIAALAVWLLSVGTLLTRAVRSRKV